jgi:hypothetical protein
MKTILTAAVLAAVLAGSAQAATDTMKMDKPGSMAMSADSGMMKDGMKDKAMKPMKKKTAKAGASMSATAPATPGSMTH